MQFRPFARGFATAASLTLVTLAAFVLAACDEDNPDFNDAGRDASNPDAAPAPVGMLPLSIPLAITDCGAMTQQTFQVVNTGNADLTYALALSDAAFTVTPSEGTVIAGASTTFTVSVTVPQGATAGTALTATLTATTNLPGSPHSVPVTVTPRGAHITITPPSVGFGQVEAGTTSGPMTALVANTGNAPATVTVASPGGEYTRIFGTAGSLTLAGSQSADATFRYAPTAVGADSGSAAVTVTGVHCGAVPTTIGLTGTGAVTGGVLVQGTPVSFGSRACGTTSSIATVTLMNTAEIAAQYTATFPTDTEGDHARYSVSPTSGSIPANSSVDLTVTRMEIALPFQPRAVDANLRINVDVPTSTNTDVAVTQTLTGPFLSANPNVQNFGFATVGGLTGSRSGPVQISNSGNAAATLQTTVSAPFSLSLAAMVGAASAEGGTMTFTPTVLGTQNGTATVTAPGTCSDPVTFTFTAGDGPLAGITVGSPAVTCPTFGSLTGSLNVSNGGNQTLEVTCVDLGAGTNDFGTTFDPPSLSVGAGSGAQANINVSLPSPVRAGASGTMLRCTTNEPLGNEYVPSLTRTLSGTDLQLSAPAALDFTCDVNQRTFYTITSGATSNLQAFVMPTGIITFPLQHDFSQITLPVGSAYGGNSVVLGGSGATTLWHGGGNPCLGSAAPGEIVFNGNVGVTMGSGTAVCSVTPATLPVVLRAGTPAAQ